MSQLSLEELEMSDDPKYRNYSNAIDKALKTFEYTSEWADLIAALGKLNKVLQSNLKFNVIPRKVVIAKRLAQCLHPALPSGVHLKALETYDLIFKLIGPAKLARELFIFSAGLYPLLAHAAINVRPVLLRLYETHLVPIIEFLKPGLSGLLSGILPGLEEGSDHFDQTVVLLDKICEGISPSIFYGSLWKCMAENPQVRLPSFVYVLSHFDRKKSVDAQLEVLGDNLDIMIHSLCSSLEDSNVLVQRSALEFLLAAFPLHGSHLLKSDLTQLLASSVTTLLRRDMSLNRRLFSWMLGNDQQNPSADDVANTTITSVDSASKSDIPDNENYFLRHSKSVLIEALYSLLKNSYGTKHCDIRAYRVLTFLLEKPEVGPAILDDILVDIFRSLYLTKSQARQGSGKSVDYDELVKTTYLLYNILEESYIWTYVGRTLQHSAQMDAEGSEVQQVGMGTPTFQEMCKLTTFLLDVLPVESNREMQTQHLPSLLSELSNILYLSQSSMSYLALLTGLDLCLFLLKKTVPSHETGDVSHAKTKPHNGGQVNEVITSDVPVCNSTAYLSAQKQRKYLEQATNGIQLLFFNLVSNALFRSEKPSDLCNAARKLTTTSSPNSDIPLETLLENFLNNGEDSYRLTSEGSNRPADDSLNALIASSGTQQSQDVEQMIMSLKTCCLIMKELSTFPIHSSDGAHYNGVEYDKNWLDLPKWLQLLCVACCCLPEDRSVGMLQMHVTTASTLLDLTASTLSMLPTKFWQSPHFQPAVQDRATSSQECSTSPSDVVSLVLLPVITPTHLVTLFKSTRVYQLLAKQLWLGLGLAADTQQQYAELLHQLHTMAPACLSNVAEDVILSDLSDQFQHSDKSSIALKKFSILWHMGRTLDPSKWGCRRLRTFDRCLFLMFDWLSLETPSVSRSASEGWLVQNLLRNDVSRLVDPLFAMLLKPHSARVSIRHAIFDQKNEAANLDGDNARQICEDDVRAISSVNGHVIYHVSPSRIQSRPFNRAVMTLGLSCEGRPPESYVDRKLAFPWQVPEQYLSDQTMELFVNPFPDENFEPEKPPAQSEDSTSAKTPSKDDDSVVIIKSLLTELVDSVVNKAIASKAAARSKRKGPVVLSPEKPSVFPAAYNHILLYCQVSDANQTLYILKIIRHLLLAQPRLVLLNFASTGLSSSRSPHSAVIVELLARHRKCLFGNGFHGEVSGDWLAPHRSSTYLEVLLTLLLSLQRSFYSNMGLNSLTRREIVTNRQVQLASIDLLTLVLTELLPLVRDLGKDFASCVSDLLVRCRVQKIALHCTVATLRIVTMDRQKLFKENDGGQYAQQVLMHEIFAFNEEEDDLKFTYFEASLVSLTKQLFSVMALEDQIGKFKTPVDLPDNVDSNQKNETAERYMKGVLIHSQPLLITAVHTALKQKNVRWIHSEFSRFLVSSLPFMGRSLPKLLGLVVPQICLNLESALCAPEHGMARADYLLCELEALTALCHYAVSDCNAGLAALASSAGILGGTICGSWVVQGVGNSSSSTHLLHNLVQSFAPDSANSKGNASESDYSALSRKQVLSSLPKILSCARYLWQMSSTEHSMTKVLRQKLLDLLTPIGQFHGTNLLSAVSLVWVEKSAHPSKNQKIIRKIIPEPTQEQSALVDLIASVKVLVPDTIVQLLRQVLKQPSQTRSGRQETALLHFFYCYSCKISKLQLGECWSSFLQLLRDLSAMTPPLLFSGLVIFEEALQRYQTPGERRDQRDLQEVATKLLEACGTLAAACLEQTTWLRRNLSVKRDTFAVTTPVDEDEGAVPSDMLHSLSSELSVFTALNDGATESGVPLSKASRYSVQALIVLAELLAPLQDLVFPSQDKERVIPLLTSLLANVIPYLKHHSHSNIYGMRAAAEMVSSLSNYPATRRAWRKDTFELLFDHQFFAIDVETLRHWRNIIDNLMSHDKDAFREFLNRVSASPSGLFSSRDQEVENRTMLLKRLAFVLFATEGDQYQRYLPDILEKLSETLRLFQTWPALQAQVFLCFRVLLLRLSHHHVTSLWPSVIAETVQVLSLLENELRRDLNDNSSHGSSSAGNGFYTNGYQAWLQLFLSACKLVHLVLSLPASRLQQFQMYRWAFIGDENLLEDSGEIRVASTLPHATPNFIPYLTRIHSILRSKAETSEQTTQCARENTAVPTIGSIKSLQDLLPLFHEMEHRDPRRVCQEDVIVRSMEKLLELDFLEPIPP